MEPFSLLIPLLAAVGAGTFGWLLAERRHRGTASRLQALVAASPVAICAIDRAGHVILWNPAAERIFGWRDDEVLGMPLPIVPESESEQHHGFRRMVQEGGAVDGEQVLRRCRDGTVVPVRLYTAAVRGDAGEVVASIGLLVDQREQVALEEQLRHSQKMQAVGEFAGGMAHDFNNLLTGIMAHAEYAQLALPHDSEPRRQLDRVIVAAERGASLIRQVLAFGRRQVLQPRVVDAWQVVHEQEPMVRRLLGEPIQLQLSGDPAAGCLRVDPSQLQQVLLNLAVNARDALPEGGRVQIGVERAEPWVHLWVSDDGLGMPEEVRSRVFEPFFTTKPEGSGLGLPTVYGIVAQSGGRVEVESATGQGTTFHLYLPRVEGPPETARSAVPPVVAEPCGGTVWLVEDEPDLLEVAEQALTRSGFAVVPMRSAEEVLERAGAAQAPDVLVTDIVLPGRNGRELADDLRARWPSLRVLFTSGYSGELLGERGILDGTVDLLEKPYRPAILAERVRRAIGRTPA